MAGVSFDKSGNIYGTTTIGGSSKYYGAGVVYELSVVESDWKESVLKAFENGTGGGTPLGEVNFDAAGNLYTATEDGGKFGYGVVLRLSAKSHAEQFLPFDGTNGAFPAAGVLIDQEGDALYGTTSAGGLGSSDAGTVYKAVGSHNSVIYTFRGVGSGDGADPEGTLILDRKGNLYGTTRAGGIVGLHYQTGCGTVFEISK